MNIEDVKNPWTVVNIVKDMPKKTGSILIKSDMGWTFVGWWDAHSRKLFVEACRNHYDNTKNERVLDGKVDSFRIKFKGDDRGMCAAWCPIPNDNEDWK